MNNTFEEILEKIKAYDTIIIHRHQRPDPDALGSQVGLRDIIRHNFPEKKVLATGKDEPTLTWLTKMDTVSDDDYQSSLVIVTDTANTPRVDDDRYTKGDFLIKIDHHPNDDAYGDLLYVDTTASSASEIITDFALSTNLALSNEAARLLYCGIVGDTGRFLYPATTSKTLSIASKLREYDFDFSTLARQMDSFSFKIAKLQGYVFDNLEVDENGAARVVLTQDTMKKFNVTDAEISAIVGTPGKIDCIQSWAIFVEQDDKHYRVRLRSKSQVINEIAKRHGGGGHPLASGANSYSLEENDKIYQEIKDLLTPKD
ncbi:bifunctional oligoribonuclease/PAP phosphatase NrnA [Streptococcus macedonicus]|uniref:DHH family phosphoesterase n=1 Tax=Streptococcus macedonicus TaxID=59310 RepID=UPI002244AA39|nr:bifunctional oligoribonuclease/PAP phosphatase NrnA [Streptococcus macedonicus]MCW8645622.1 bifunctional oligoribonuclease/PAP phosphatase NrnA [Streptococcus macedonicus]